MKSTKDGKYGMEEWAEEIWDDIVEESIVKLDDAISRLSEGYGYNFVETHSLVYKHLRSKGLLPKGM